MCSVGFNFYEVCMWWVGDIWCVFKVCIFFVIL